MSLEDTIGYRQNVPACAVCGKNVLGGGGFARVNHKGHLVELCCPLCLETFEQDPDHYPSDTPACAVCGKSAQGGSGFTRLNRNGHLVELCCPLCQATFEKDPDAYLRRLEKLDYFRYLSELEKPLAKA